MENIDITDKEYACFLTGEAIKKYEDEYAEYINKELDVIHSRKNINFKIKEK